MAGRYSKYKQDRKDQIRWRWMTGAFVLSIMIYGCRLSDPVNGPEDPFAGRQPSQFEITLLLDIDPVPEAETPGRCDTPIRAQAIQDDLKPEENLKAILSRQGELTSEQTTDPTGFASLTTTTSGRFILELVSNDKLLRGTLPIDVTVESTSITGYMIPDHQDLDGDGDTQTWVMIVDILPDANSDLVSDTGRKARWVISKNRRVEFNYIGRGLSVKTTTESESGFSETIEFPDNDGDFVPDETDDDRDGDGIPNNQDSPIISCPGFLHSSLSTPGSKHAKTKCNDCHETEAFFCDDCHTPSGRNWIFSPNPDLVPTGHFQRGCGHCHLADQPWSKSPGPTGNHHDLYPISGAHRNTDCLACHITGNLHGVSKTCEGCHVKDAAEQHATKTCGLCHQTDSWDPPVTDHTTYPLEGGHVGVVCTKCHGAVLPEGKFKTEKPDQACSTCHDLPAGHFPIPNHSCNLCHVFEAWKPPVTHQGDLPNTVFDYTQWSTGWFPIPHFSAIDCRACHTNIDNQKDITFYNCTTASCHGGPNETKLNETHNWGEDVGNDPSTQFHLYFFSATDPDAPAAWPTAHTGCVSVDCHYNGKLPYLNIFMKDRMD